MKTLNVLAAIVLMSMMTHPVLCQENPVDTVHVERIDTVWIEKTRVDTVYVEKANPELTQNQNTQVVKEPQKSKGRNEKVYYGGYANVSIGQYSRIGFEPLIAYKLFPKFSVGAKLRYEYVRDKRYDITHQSSNYGVSVFARRRFLKRLYAHIEYAEMNYKLYDAIGASDRYWVSFLFLGGGVSLPISKNASLNAEALWDLIQDQHSPYKTVQPFFNVGIGIGF